jgi:hypothetical protein
LLDRLVVLIFKWLEFMPRKSFVFLLFFLVVSAINLSAQDDDLNQSNQNEHHELLGPKLNPPEQPTKVSIGVSLLKVIYIEPASEELPQIQAKFKLALEWQDKRLTIRKKHQVDIYQDDEAKKILNKIFAPHMKILDGDLTVDHQELRIYLNGTVTLNQVVNVVVPANMHLFHFPFDSQTFNFQFVSTHWDMENVDLYLNHLETKLLDNAAPEAWQFDYSTHHITNSNVRSQGENFYVLNFLIHAKRDPRYYIWRLLIPLFIIVLLSWNVFWIYEDAISSLENCFLFLLTIVAFHQIANSMLPTISFFTFLDAIVFISYGFIIIPTFQVMLTIKLESKGKNQQAEVLRKYCRWSVPISFLLAMLTITLIYFSQS